MLRYLSRVQPRVLRASWTASRDDDWLTGLLKSFWTSHPRHDFESDRQICFATTFEADAKAQPDASSRDNVAGFEVLHV